MEAEFETEEKESPQKSGFAELCVCPELVSRLSALGITRPTEIQRKVIPLAAQGKNVVFQSETGSGKTLAFLLPLLQKIDEEKNEETGHGETGEIIIVSPTFELASQLKQAALSVSDKKAALFIGGASIKRQTESLKERPEIIIGTPARLLELARLKKIKAHKTRALILDEADRLFAKEIEESTRAFTSLFSRETQFIACSATITKKVQTEFERLGGASCKILLPRENVLREKMEHWAFFAERRDKIDFVRSLLNALKAKDKKSKKTLIFTSRVDQVQNITAKLQFKGVNCAGLHAKLKNQERQSLVANFTSGKTPVLVTSDLASRGLDISGIEYILQTDFPSDPDFFVHRAGRTARAGMSGVNIIVGDEYELRQLSLAEKRLGIRITPMQLRGGRIESFSAQKANDEIKNAQTQNAKPAAKRH